jgi:hypothetical protein
MRNFGIIQLGTAAFVLMVFILLNSCDKDNGGRPPLPPINITLDPNSTIYQELNVVGGWLYLYEQDGAEPPSRGIIVYRLSTDLFAAYERTPPFKPDSCCNAAKTNCTKLLVDNYYPFVMDTCTSSKYLILDGSPISGPSNMTLSTYVTEYYGGLLSIHD